MSDGQNIPAKMMSLQLKDMNLLYSSYMPFLEHGGLFVQTNDVFSIGDDILLAVEILNFPKLFLPKLPQTVPADQSRLDQSCAYFLQTQRGGAGIHKTRKLPESQRPDRSRTGQHNRRQQTYVYHVTPCISSIRTATSILKV